MPVTLTTDSNAVAERLRPLLDDTTEIIRQRVLAAAMSAAEEVGQDAVVRTVEQLSVPVDYSTSPPTRSLPGEPPRMDEDVLRSNVDFVVTQSGEDTVTATIYASRPAQDKGDDADAAPILEFGGRGNWGNIQPRDILHERTRNWIMENVTEIASRHIARSFHG